MTTTVADYLIKRLNSLGITEIFGLPGDFNFEIVEAIEKNNNVNWIGSTNELNAGYAADGYARVKGYGAIVTTYGVGELSAINAIAGAMAENVPVVKIVGVPGTKYIKNKTLLHHNLMNANYFAFRDAYTNIVETTAYLDENNAKQEIDRVLNVLIKTKRPVYIALPMDIALKEIEDDFKTLEIKSDFDSLNKAADKICAFIKASKTPCVLADVLAKRFGAKKEIESFLKKTLIPSTAFNRGIGLINSSVKNYLGVYVGKHDNKICYDYLNSSDCIIALGVVLSDLNTFGFDYKFNLDNHIIIQPDYVLIKGEKFENVLIKDLIALLVEKIDYEYKDTLLRTFKYEKAVIEKVEPLSAKYLYPRLNEFLKEDDVLITEVGIIPSGVTPMVLADNIQVENQLLWGSIGWATAAAEGASYSNKRTILITGDGSFQLTAQEISTMMRNKLKPIIFVINNAGYTIERILCDDVHYKYNDIASWDYSKLPTVFKGDCFVAQARTNKEFDEVLKVIETKNTMCYIELFTDYLDIPFLALASAKHPEQLQK